MEGRLLTRLFIVYRRALDVDAAQDEDRCVACNGTHNLFGKMLVKPSTETHASVKPATMFLPILSAPQMIKERNALPSLMLVLMWQDSSCISDEQVSVCFFGANLIFEK